MCVYIYIYIYLSIYLSIYLYIYLSIYLYIYLSLSLYIYIYIYIYIEREVYYICPLGQRAEGGDAVGVLDGPGLAVLYHKNISLNQNFNFDKGLSILLVPIPSEGPRRAPRSRRRRTRRPRRPSPRCPRRAGRR